MGNARATPPAATRKRFAGKLSRPRLENVVARTRLFRLLDRARKRPIVWIAAPAGFGKTTLVASYLKTRRLEHLWYQIDARDRDPATFFYYLREAVSRRAPRKRETLPLLTPDYLHGLPAFTRHFFELAFARLKPPAVLVLDNYQDIPESAPLHALLPAGLSQVPDGVTVVILSRTAPPPAFTRLGVQQAMTVIDAEALTLTLPEARRIARLHAGAALAPGTLAALHARVRGWAAGWVLLLERARKGSLTTANIPRGAREAMFDYFAAELFNRTSTPTQELLMQCALLPQMTAAMAQFVTGRARAEAVLTHLVRQGHFTTRADGLDACYQFHPLFREFLLDRARTHFDSGAYRGLTQRAASALIAAGQPDQAAELLRDAGDRAALITLILEYAPILTAQGRLATLERWLHGVPAATIESDPQLCHWLGTCRMPYDLREARAHFERAYAGFKRAAQPLGMYLAWASIVETLHYEWDDFTPLDHWIDEIDALRREHPLERYPDAQVRVVCAALPMLSFARADTVDLAPWRRHAEALLDRTHGTPHYVAVAGCLLAHHIWSGNLGEVRRLARELESHVTAPETEPLARLYGLRGLAMAGWLLGEPESTRRWAALGIEDGARLGIDAHEPALLGQLNHACAIDDDLAAAQTYLVRCQRLAEKSGRLHQAHYDFTRAWFCLRKGDLRASRAHAEKALALAERLTARFGVVLGRARLAEVLAYGGEYDAAHRHLDEVAAFCDRQGSPVLKSMVDTLRAFTWLRQGRRDDAALALARALERQRRLDIVAYANWNSGVMAALCEFALAQDIEPEFARRLIHARCLLPESPSWALQTWPFPLKLYTFGRFGVLHDDRPLTPCGNKKPLELLKALVALGGRDVNDDRLMELLWPDADGDTTRHSLKITVHRLRKLLPDRVLTWTEGKLALDPRRVWVDVWAFERLLGQLDAALANTHRDDANLMPLVRKALTLYGGAFLADEAHHWALTARERLRGKFLRVIDRAGDAACARANYRDALDCYESALGVDPLAERFYRGVMRCNQQLKRPAEAVAAYLRCREVLARELNIAPSQKTEALYRRLRTA